MYIFIFSCFEPLLRRRWPRWLSAGSLQMAGSLQLNGAWHESGCYCAGRTTQRDEGEGGAASCDSCRERPFPTAPRWTAGLCVGLCNVNTRAWPGAWSCDETVCDGSVFVYHLNIWSPRVTNTAASHAVTSGRPRMRREEEQGPAGGDSHVHLNNPERLLILTPDSDDVIWIHSLWNSDRRVKQECPDPSKQEGSRIETEVCLFFKCQFLSLGVSCVLLSHLGKHLLRF